MAIIGFIGVIAAMWLRLATIGKANGKTKQQSDERTTPKITRQWQRF